MARTALPIAHWLDDATAAGGPISERIGRLTGNTTRIVPAGRRHVTVTVLVAPSITSPTITAGGVTTVLPEGTQLSLGSDYPADQLDTLTVAANTGDDVLIVETWLT